MKIVKFIFILLIFVFTITQSYAKNANTGKSAKENERGLDFILQYMIVDNVLKGETGLGKELSTIVDISVKHFDGQEPFTNFWFDISRAYCIKEINFDMYKFRSKEEAQTGVMEDVQICTQKYILDNWDLINETIKNRYKQITDPTYFEKFKKKK